MTAPFIPDLRPLARALAFAGLTLWLAGCVTEDPNVDSGSYAQPAPPRHGYGSRPAANFGPYDLPEYEGGYTPD